MMMDYINAFWVGGVVCALAQIFLDRTKDAARACDGAACLHRGSDQLLWLV